MAALQSHLARVISPAVTVSRLLAMFIALSLLFGPLAMERAMAAAPASHHSLMSHDSSQTSADPTAMAGHCQPGRDKKSPKAPSEPCCAAMCATSAVLPDTTASEMVFEQLAAIPAPVRVHRGVLREIVTPPPRTA